jgi:hypothetical protein
LSHSRSSSHCNYCAPQPSTKLASSFAAWTAFLSPLFPALVQVGQLQQRHLAHHYGTTHCIISSANNHSIRRMYSAIMLQAIRNLLGKRRRDDPAPATHIEGSSKLEVTGRLLSSGSQTANKSKDAEFLKPKDNVNAMSERTKHARRQASKGVSCLCFRRETMVTNPNAD